MTKTRTFNEMCQYDTLEGRFNYLKLDGQVGIETYGYDRYINQRFYSSREWKRIRDMILLRDDGCNLGLPGLWIQEAPIVHHMNPIAASNIIEQDDLALLPIYLVTTNHKTHNAIHYGDVKQLPKDYTKRHAGDTKLW